jgi:hypothetical protein
MSWFSVRFARSRSVAPSCKLRPTVEELENRVVPTLLGQNLFPANNPWNQVITNAPVAGASTGIINNVIALHKGSNNPIHPDFGQDSQSPGNTPLYGIPYNVVHGNSTPKVHVIIDNYPGESDLQDAPIVSGVVIEGDFQSGPNHNVANRGDSHLIVWDQDNNIDYEFGNASRPSENADGMWHAGQETVWDMKVNTFRTLGFTSADAAGLAILPGLVRPDEGLTVGQGGQGAINHAIRFTLNNPIILDQFIYPASHIANSNTDPTINPPMGARFRLKASVNISTLNPEAKIIAQAMQTYGLILADNGSDFYFSGASFSVDANGNFSKTWDDNDIQDTVHGLKSLHYADFEMVDLTPRVTSLSTQNAAAGVFLTVNGQNFSGAAGHLQVFFGTTAATSVTVLSDTQIQVVVPAGSGQVHVTVQSGVTVSPADSQDFTAGGTIFGYGTSTTSANDLFTYAAAGITVSPAKLPNWTLNQAGYNATESASGGSTPYTFAVTGGGSLPNGLNLNANTGAITGKPTVAGTFNFTITATDNIAHTGSQSYSVVINPAVAISTASLPNSTVNQAGYGPIVLATGGTGALTFSVSMGALPNGLMLNNATGAITGTPTVAGTFNFTILATDGVNATGSKAFSVVINPAAAPLPPPPPPSSGSTSSNTPPPAAKTPSASAPLATPPSIIVTGADAGAAPQITVYDASTASLQTAFYGLPPAFPGGARVALGDVNGDGVLDYIVAAGPGAAPQITVYDGKTRQPFMSFYGLPVGFTGGCFVAAADVNHDGFADIIVSADRGGGPQVTITSGKDGTMIASFYATTPTFTGGIRVTAADINGDGFADVIAVAGPGGGPQVTIFDGRSLSLLTAFYATAPTFNGGLYVAAGDLNGDGKADIAVGAGPGGAPQVWLFDGPTQTMMSSFLALPAGFTGGVRVAVAFVNGKEAVVASAGPGGGPQVTVFDSSTLAVLESFYATAPTFTGGIFVA